MDQTNNLRQDEVFVDGNHPSGLTHEECDEFLERFASFTRLTTGTGRSTELGNAKGGASEYITLWVGTAPLYDHPTKPITEQVYFVSITVHEGGARGDVVNTIAFTEAAAWAWYYGLTMGVKSYEAYANLVRCDD